MGGSPVCPKLGNLYDSKVSSGILFIDGELTPENIAKTKVKNEDRGLVDYNNLLNAIDKDFCASINNFLIDF